MPYCQHACCMTQGLKTQSLTIAGQLKNPYLHHCAESLNPPPIDNPPYMVNPHPSISFFVPPALLSAISPQQNA